MLFGLLRDPDGREALETLLSGAGLSVLPFGSPAAAVRGSPGWRLKKTGTSPSSARSAGMFVARTLAGTLSVLVLEEKGRTGGAGAMTDGKLNLSAHIGLDLASCR